MLSNRGAWLVLEDGTAMQGRCVGASGEVFGELVFNTSMSGYQEILTDPSYKGQIVCMTYPHIGNYGVNKEDIESHRPWLEGFVMKQLSPVASNYRAEEALDSYLVKHGIVAIDGVDTRALTMRLRERGSLKAGISTTERQPERLLARVKDSPDVVGRDLVKEVTCKKPYVWPIDMVHATRDGERGELEGGIWREKSVGRGKEERAAFSSHIVVMDLGVKYGILRELALLGAAVTVVPAYTKAEEIIALKPEGVVLSNGPGDPAAVCYAAKTIQALLGRVPLFGICLGHQLLALAFGAKTYKLKFGHHGANHPVKDVSSGRVYITTQNHGFAVELDSVAQRRLEVTHANLNDGTIEGVRGIDLPVIGIQYHPEASPGPHDARGLFRDFLYSSLRFL